MFEIIYLLMREKYEGNHTESILRLDMFKKIKEKRLLQQFYKSQSYVTIESCNIMTKTQLEQIIIQLYSM